LVQQRGQFALRKALLVAKKALHDIVKDRFETFDCAGVDSKIKPVALKTMAKH